jgi:site-specific recombinase XerD
VRKRRATANRILTVLKAALNHAWKSSHVASDDAWRRVKPFRAVETARVRYLSEDECIRLVNACEPAFRNLVRGALLTGCRYSELTAMHVADFNADAGVVTVRESKVGKPRHVVLTDEGQHLFATLTVGKLRDEPIFTRRDGGTWGKSHQLRPMVEACHRAKIKPAVSFHVLRHTHGSTLAMRGVPMGVIAEQLRHSDTRMTEKHYAHLAPSYVAATIRAHFPILGIGRDEGVVPLRAGSVGQPSPDTSPPRPARPAPTLTGGGAVVVMAAEAKTTSRSLIAISDVEGVFNDEIVKELARIAKLPADPDIARFAQSIRISARIFLEEKNKLNFPQLRTAIERLYRLNTRAEDGNDRTARALASAVDAMPADVRQWLQSCNSPHHRNIPTAAEILSPPSRESAVTRLRQILSYGGSVVEGRKRSGGRRSLSFKPLLRIPERTKSGRPRGEAEREFVQWLAVAYVEVTGRPPPRTAHYNIDIRGPFSDFVHRCFELVGAPTGNVTRLLNQYGAVRREAPSRGR